MILLDTNVLIYAADTEGPLGEWARELIEDAVAGEGAGANAICLAEVCAGDGRPETVAIRLRDWGVAILDVPVAAAEICAAAHRRYLARRRQRSDSAVPGTPLPDFFIGAHAEVMGWSLATADAARFHDVLPVGADHRPVPTLGHADRPGTYPGVAAVQSEAPPSSTAPVACAISSSK